MMIVESGLLFWATLYISVTSAWFYAQFNDITSPHLYIVPAVKSY